MIFVDTFEPKQIEDLLSQTVDTIRMTLNHSPQGYADYLFFAYDGHRIQDLIIFIYQFFNQVYSG